MATISKRQPRPAALPRHLENVTITVRPNNLARIHPVADRLAPLLPYQDLVLQAVLCPQPDPGENALVAADLSPCSVIPAGLVPRFKAELAARGYAVTVDDRRRSAPGPRVNTEFCERAKGRVGDFLRAAVSAPLLCVEFNRWHDLVWRVSHLCAVYPDARVVIATECADSSVMLHNDLVQIRHPSVGLVGLCREVVNERCLLTSAAGLRRLPPGICQVLVVILQNERTLTDETYRSVRWLRTPRVYTLVEQGFRLGKRKALRLEAMAGPLIDSGGRDEANGGVR